MFDSYRHNCCMNFIDIEIDASEFLFKKKNNNNNNENNVERMNKNENIFEFIEIDIVF